MSKRFQLRYFAAFREHAGVSEESVTLDADSAADVFTQLKDRHGFTSPFGNCKVAINDQIAGWDSPVADGDVILFFPPVAGG